MNDGMKLLSELRTLSLTTPNAFARMAQPIDQREHDAGFQPCLRDHRLSPTSRLWFVAAECWSSTLVWPRNRATAARVAAKLAPNNHKLFLTTTHFHPERVAGEPGFPPGTILIRNSLQQQEMGEALPEMIDTFSKGSAQNKELLAGAVSRYL